MEGWIKLHRQIIDSPVFAHPTALKIWIWFLCRANHSNKIIQLDVGGGYTTVKLTHGQFVFGRHKAEEELGIDGSTIYKWLKKFETELQMIKVESNNKYSIVTILKFKEFQSTEELKIAAKEQQKNNSVTAKEQQSNTDKNANNEENVILAATATSIQDRSAEFYKLLIPFVDKYTKETVREFFEYWTEKSANGKKLRFEGEKFFDVSRRLATWNSRQFKKPKVKEKGGFVS